ncbi:MBL fold metallo-hydrolase [Tumebacillus sp. ITR2]|uniref:MBL fold metallo-hydrolase n=1 Tax=Tumebacillus amylolyticus TaxID=2801339 RepID=A0ABS1JDP6_9BACL|nr:MBL fold metallo-hydrolase [Tumebacillus amylolyticus]MBL0388406.1 MBL fold metallo-hydrolase [Tumebacillus amylolyticus]
MQQEQPQSLETSSGMLGENLVPDILSLTLQIVNVQFIGTPGESSDWVLIDAGMPGSMERIVEVAEQRFGSNRPPKAIILTHGHFDHVGAFPELLEKWDVPVYAHPLEIPYLTGREEYPPPDPTVGGGLLAGMSFLFPNDPIQLGSSVQALPEDGSVPFLEGWKWLHTPGHTKGHISLFREADRVVLAGDAFITVKQESLFSVLTQEPILHGPPWYFTPDWEAAEDSVRRLADLKPAVAYTGHGWPMSGDVLTQGLELLARDFKTLGKPQSGRYVH